MSVINVLRQHNAVHVLSDGAAYDGMGKFVYFQSKVLPAPHLNAVIACRGMKLTIPFVADALASCAESYDALRSMAGSVSKLFFEQVTRGSAREDIEIVVAGFSEKGPDSYVVVSHNRSPGIAPWTVVDTGAAYLSPFSEDVANALKSKFPDPNVGCMDAARDGLAIMELQRSQFPRVGGFAQLTTVTEWSITMRVLKRWPDRLAGKGDDEVAAA